MRQNIEYTKDVVKTALMQGIYEIFDKYKKKDTSGDISIQSGDISDESLYLLCGFEPEWNDDIEDNVLFPCEIVEFWENDNILDVRTFERGSMHVNDLDLDDLMRCYEYLSILEEEDEAKE